MLAPTQDIFTHVLLRAAIDHSNHALLSWRSHGQGNRLVQVYVDGQRYDVTTRASQQHMWLHVDRTRSVRVELLAVDRQEAWRDHRMLLKGWSPAICSHASLAMARDERLPIDSRVIVKVDDQDEPAMALWTDADARAGFGGLHGLGEFGRDHATAPGLGIGEFGFGPIGYGGSAWQWERDDLAAGEHELSVRVFDAVDIVAAELEQTRQVTITSLPDPAHSARSDSNFELTWKASSNRSRGETRRKI